MAPSGVFSVEARVEAAHQRLGNSAEHFVVPDAQFCARADSPILDGLASAAWTIAPAPPLARSRLSLWRQARRGEARLWREERVIVAG